MRVRDRTPKHLHSASGQRARSRAGLASAVLGHAFTAAAILFLVLLALPLGALAQTDSMTLDTALKQAQEAAEREGKELVVVQRAGAPEATQPTTEPTGRMMDVAATA